MSDLVAPAQSLQHLLKRSQQQLNLPFSNVQRRLLYLINIAYVLLTPLYLLSEKIATGSFVPDVRLWFVYSFVWIINLVSGLYTFLSLHHPCFRLLGYPVNLSSPNPHPPVERMLRWGSLLSVMLMSLVNMLGVGNPATDTLLLDFALAHSLIMLAAMVLGRKAMLGWTGLVLSTLIYVTFFQVGYDYQFNYLTPTESARYKTALQQHRPWALQRQAVLKANHLNPPRASRYFNTWLIFILVAAATAYFFAGVALDLFAVVPEVTQDIQQALNASNREEEQRMHQQQELLRTELKALKAQVNPHFLYNTLNYLVAKSEDDNPELADALLKLAGIMRYSTREDFGSVPLTEELTYIRQYISLHQLRHPLQLQFTVEGPIESKTILPMLLVGLVENAFKHGNLIDPLRPFIIDLRVHDDRIEFFTQNRKNKKQRPPGTRIGLQNTRQQLARSYAHQTFDVEEDDDTFSCRLIIYT